MTAPTPAEVEALAEVLHRVECGCDSWTSDDQEDQSFREIATAVLAVGYRKVVEP